MKIAVTGARGIPNILGGVETHCEELFPLIAAKSFDVTVFCRTNYVRDNLSEYKGVKLLNISAPKVKSLEAIVHTFKSVIVAKFKLNADIVHIHAIGPALLVPLARLLGLKVVFTHHGADYEREKWGSVARLALRFGEYLGCKFANEVIVISSVINESIKAMYGRYDAHLIYNGVPKPVFIKTTNYLSELGVKPRQYIFAMGRFVPEKNFHQLIEAFSSLKDDDYKLVLTGDADHEGDYSLRLKKQAKENSVILTGFIKGDKLHELLTHARGFVLPSSHEGLPISLLEAMSYGLPIIASDIPANREIGLPAEVYFNAGDSEQLVQKLVKLINTDNQFVKYNMDRFDWEEIAGKTVFVYKR